MKIYTGSPGGSESKMQNMERLHLGIMLSSEVNKRYKNFSCALDNGAFECYRRGFPWSEKRFFDLIEKSWSSGLSLDFIIAPDIVAGGLKSLRQSEQWFPKLQPAKIALAVQDGMVTTNLMDINFDVLFIGGSVEWKWKTAKQWVDYAHGRGKKCHIGRCGTLDKLRYAKSIGADSVDSTSIVRNESWHIIEELQEQKQQSLFAIHGA